MDSFTQVLLQSIRNHSEDMDQLRKEIAELRVQFLLERQGGNQRSMDIERQISDLNRRMETPVEFTFSHLKKVPLLQAAFAIGAMIGALRLPEESANVLIGVAKLLTGM
jgi:hypothetical protein